MDDNGVAYVAMREIVEGIGLDWKSQHRKLIDQSSKFSFTHTHITTMGKTEKDIKNSVCLFQN